MAVSCSQEHSPQPLLWEQPFSPIGEKQSGAGAPEGDEPEEVSPSPMPGTRDFTLQHQPVHGINCPCKPNTPFLHTSALSIILVPPLMGKQPEKRTKILIISQ